MAVMVGAKTIPQTPGGRCLTARLLASPINAKLSESHKSSRLCAWEMVSSITSHVGWDCFCDRISYTSRINPIINRLLMFIVINNPSVYHHK